jgi:hypothetical protein
MQTTIEQIERRSRGRAAAQAAYLELQRQKKQAQVDRIASRVVSFLRSEMAGLRMAQQRRIRAEVITRVTALRE